MLQRSSAPLALPPARLLSLRGCAGAAAFAPGGPSTPAAAVNPAFAPVNRGAGSRRRPLSAGATCQPGVAVLPTNNGMSLVDGSKSQRTGPLRFAPSLWAAGRQAALAQQQRVRNEVRPPGLGPLRSTPLPETAVRGIRDQMWLFGWGFTRSDGLAATVAPAETAQVVTRLRKQAPQPRIPRIFLPDSI